MSVLNFHSAESGFYAHFSDFFHRKRRNLEHFARALAVRAGDFRRIYILKSALLKERMDCKCHLVSHTVYCAERICAGAKMRVFA